MDTVTIFNQALSAIGHRALVVTEDEASREASICRMWYASVRDQILRSAPWASAKRAARLELLSERPASGEWEAEEPQPGYQYAYELPTDMLAPRYLSSYSPFEISMLDATTKALMANEEDVILIYTMQQTDPDLWDPHLTMAIVYALASFICNPLTGKRATGADVAKRANDLIMTARDSLANLDQAPHESIPDWIAARGYVNLAPPTRYFFPYTGALIPVGGPDVK